MADAKTEGLGKPKEEQPMVGPKGERAGAIESNGTDGYG